jgi:hypothetical protein
MYCGGVSAISTAEGSEKPTGAWRSIAPPPMLGPVRRALPTSPAVLALPILGLSVLGLGACGARTALEVDAGPRDAATFDAASDAPPPECRRDADCDDGLECSADTCESLRCLHRGVDARCDDGLFCTGPGRCDLARGCVNGERPPCADALACTLDVCVEALDACEHEPDATLCPLSHRCDPELGCVARAVIHDTDGRLFEIDLPGGSVRSFGSAMLPLTDITLHSDGIFYAITTRSLFRLDPSMPGSDWRFVAALGDDFVALDVHPGGELVGAGRPVVAVINRATGRSTRINDLPGRWLASGDIAFVRGRMLVSATQTPGSGIGMDHLFEVPLDGATPFDLGPIGFGCVWGLAPFGDTLYGFTCRSELIEIDPTTGTGRLRSRMDGTSVGAPSLRVGGAAAR